MKYSALLIALFICTLTAHAEINAKREFTKEFHKEFAVDRDATIDLTNKYGKVNIQTTSGAQVVIDVQIIVDASSQSEADDLFERIEVDFSNSSHYVKAETLISSRKMGWLKQLFSSGGKNSYEINYTVQMPKSCELKLSNRYGDSFVDNLENRADVEIKYGAIEMLDVQGTLDLDLKYGKGSAGIIGDGDIEIGYSVFRIDRAEDIDIALSYSTLELNEARNIDAEIKYSNLKIQKAAYLSCESKYDDIHLGTVNELMLESRYTSAEADDILEKASFEMGYGGLSIHHLSGNFQMIKIETDYTGVKINLDNDAAFKLDAATEYTSVKLPDLSTTVDIRKDNESNIKGYYRNQSGGEIYARMRYGGLRIQ